MLIVFASLFFLLLILNFPVFVAFFLSSLIALAVYMPNIPLEIIVQTSFRMLDKFSLVSVPFFIFAANIMTRSGMAETLVKWALSLVGRIKGSLGMGTIMAAEFFGALSGSSPATVAAIGKIMYPALLQNKYGERYSLGLITAGGAIAILIPPSITMIIYASIGNVSVGKLFIAGILPGLLVGLLYALWTIYYVTKNKVPVVGQFDLKEIVLKSKEAVWAMGVPIVILGGIYTGIFTPTESAVVSSVYAIFVGLFIYKSITIIDVYNIAVDTAVLTAQIFIIVSAAGIFAWVLTIERVPQLATAFVNNSALSNTVLLILINLVILIAGMFVHPSSITIIFTPIFLPIVMAMGMDPVHFGVILTLNLAIGMYTPPFGLNIFTSSAIFNLPVSRIVPSVIPFVILSLIALVLVTYIPQISMWLPGMMK